MRRWSAIALLFFAFACTTTTSVTRTGTGLFASSEDAADEQEPPRGLTLSVNSVTPDGMVVLDLRNYSMDPFVFAGAPDRPRLVIELDSGDTHSRYTIRRWSRSKTHEVPAGERLQLKVDLSGVHGHARIGIRSHQFGFIVWTNSFAL